MNPLGLKWGRRVLTTDVAVVAAQTGDADAREQLLREFMPFILKVASRATGRYLRPGVDEEISVALMAFNEAIDGFQSDRGGFLSFAETVVRRRLVDYFRRKKPSTQELTWTDLEVEDAEGEVRNPAMDRVAEVAWAVAEEQESRRLEIEEFREILAQHGISFDDLVAGCPKHRDARERAIQIARLVVADKRMRASVAERHELPLKMLATLPGVRRKTIERHRRYIIAVALVLMHDLPYLQEYVLHQEVRA